MDFTKTTLGIEFGSTRVKAVLIDKSFRVIAEGVYDWENSFDGGYWTYAHDEILTALQQSFAALSKQVGDRYGAPLTTVGAIGISAMMHGYIALDKDDRFLVPFRTWRNTTTGEAAGALTKLFSFNIPERWSIAHLYQAILNGEAHLPQLSALTTLAGYLHRRLTGLHTVGVGEAAGMFPIDAKTLDYDTDMVAKFDALAGSHGFTQPLRSLLPEVRAAGEAAGTLTKEGALLLDPTGRLQPGIPFCPPEGDAGTGMVATDSVRPRTGNVSAGTSVFAMVVLERPLTAVYPEIDLVTTPDGAPVAMVHCNNCTADIDAWAHLLLDFAAKANLPLTKDQAFSALYNAALAGEGDAGGLLSFNYLSGESITGVKNGVPLLLRPRGSALTFPNFARNLLFSALSTLRIGMELLQKEQVAIDCLYGHGGLFKAAEAGSRMMAAATGSPVTVMQTANVGGPWGMAILAMYLLEGGGRSLPDYLDEAVFAATEKTTTPPDAADCVDFDNYLKRYKAALGLEKAAEALLYGEA
jgi:sugar (pentulose or hexulose) kinase